MKQGILCTWSPIILLLAHSDPPPPPFRDGPGPKKKKGKKREQFKAENVHRLTNTKKYSSLYTGSIWATDLRTVESVVSDKRLCSIINFIPQTITWGLSPWILFTRSKHYSLGIRQSFCLNDVEWSSNTSGCLTLSNCWGQFRLSKVQNLPY